MTQLRLPRYRTAVGACVLVLSGLCGALAQQGASPFPPPPAPGQQPGQSSSAFPPPPGQTGASNPFPPAPGQSSAFPSPGQVRAPASGGFTAAPQGGGFSAAPQGGGFGAPGGGGPSEAQKVCLTFPSVREEVEKGAATIKAASDRKATREEVCPLFKAFASKEAKLVKFLETNQKLCGVPPKVITQVRSNHSNTIRIRNQVCSSAPSGPPPGPTLSDALGGPVIANDPTVNKGRGTFDTLTGNVLSR